MKNYFGKNVLVGLIVVCLAIIASAYLMYSHRIAPPISNQNPPVSGQNDSTKTAIYRNEKYGYALEYPSSLYVNDRVPDKVYFTEESLYGIIAVEVASTTYMNADDELKAKNEKYNSHDFLEKRIKIAGYDAIVTYPVSMVDEFPDQAESFPHEKTVLLIKDGLLFRIATRGTDHERVWNSFRFE